jgi:hypothetical protein
MLDKLLEGWGEMSAFLQTIIEGKFNEDTTIIKKFCGETRKLTKVGIPPGNEQHLELIYQFDNKNKWYTLPEIREEAANSAKTEIIPAMQMLAAQYLNDNNERQAL